MAALLGGIINPLYSLLIAHTNDYLTKEDMPGASAGLIFLNGFGAIFGPLAGRLADGRDRPEGLFPDHRRVVCGLAAYAG